ncbi:MAG: hypothetical protein MUP98_00180 [Candidatus Aminicenantes bacterium]|nr:hypothetical protein [Candidatus Aminicenantes bacterium]
MSKYDEIEKLLENFSRKPPPDGLRERVLNGTIRRRVASRLLTSVQWKSLFFAGVLGFISLVLDTGLMNVHKKHMASLLELPQVTSQKEYYTENMLIDLFGGMESNRMIFWMIKRCELRRKAKSIEIHNKFIQVIKEDFNGS